MKINVNDIDEYAVTTWYAVSFTMQDRDDEFGVVVTEMYDANGDHLTYDITCTDGDLTDAEIGDIKDDLLWALTHREEKDVKMEKHKGLGMKLVPEEIIEHIMKIIGYGIIDEQKHFDECDKPEVHIYRSFKAIEDYFLNHQDGNGG